MSNLWQQPYVNVFKHFKVSEWKKSSKEGEVSTLMDKTVKSTVFKITGHIPAGNYIQLPKTGSQSLGLTGRFFYLLFRPIPTKYFVVHIDVATQDSLVVRLSFSNLFKEFKSTSTWLQFPYLCNPAKGSVAFVAAVGSKEHAGPAPTSTRWTVLCLDLSYILSMYLNRTYAHVKNIRLCANMLVKNIFTSDVLYDPGISLEEAKRLSGRHVSPLPREFGFHVPKGDMWHNLYDLIRFPPEGDKKPFDSIQFSVDDSNNNVDVADDFDRPRRIAPHPQNISKCVSERVSMIHKLTTPKQYPKHQALTQELPELQTEMCQSNVHIYAHPKDSSDDETKPQNAKKTKNKVLAHIQVTSVKSNYKALEPDPILQLKRIVGFGGATFRDVFWSGDLSSVVYPCHAVIVAMRISNGHQRFFIGHTDKVSCLTLNGNSTLLASGQTGQMSVVRIWKFKSGECLSVCKTHAHSLFCLSFAHNGNVLCGVGKDGHGKNLVVIWSTSHVLKRREVSVLAKAHTDVDIVRMCIAAFDDMRMVSCGRDNVRFWRVKDGTLRSAPVNMGEYHSVDFTDICFEAGFHANKNPEDRLIYACSRSGHVFEIDYQKVAIHHVRRLLPVARNKNPIYSGSGLAITSMSVNETFCVTGSDDGFLRLWPLDFAHVYLEAEHDGSVMAVNLSTDGLKILAGTSTGNLGILDVSTRDYVTIMRSHTNRVLSIAVDPYRKHLATVSLDHTIRVWDAETLQQLYDFSAPQESPSTISYHPNCQIFACGFESGAVRVFNVLSTCLLVEHKQHRGSITGVTYSPNGDYLYSACSQGTLAAYNSADSSYDIIRVLANTVARGTRFSPDALTVSKCGRRLAFIGPSDFTITVVDAKFLSELLRVDITNLTSDIGREGIDTAVQVLFTPPDVGHLLVTTSSNRLVKLDAHTGRLIAEVNHIHRSGCTSIMVSQNGKYLVTAGDKVLKVWDYNMALDINFQVFIGHSESVSKILYTPDGEGVISTGEAIYIWDNLAVRPATPPLQGRQISEEASGLLRSFGQSVDEAPRHAPPKPIVPSYSTAYVEDLSSIQNDDEMKVSSLTSKSLSPRNVFNDFLPDVHHSHPQDSTVVSNVKDTEDVYKAEYDALSAKGGKSHELTKHSPYRPKARIHTTKMKKDSLKPVCPKSVTAEAMKPSCHKHFTARKKLHAIPQRCYTAPPNQAGMRLANIIGFNGNGQDNMVWSPDTGLFAYSCGCVIVLEDLSTGQQTHMQGHTEEISTIAVQHDFQVLASASGAFDKESHCQICVWDLSQKSCRKVLNHHQHEVICMAYSRDDRFLLTVGDYREREIVVWGTATYSVLTSAKTEEPIHCVKWDPYTVNEFASVGDGGCLIFWLLDETTPSIELSVHQADVLGELINQGGRETAFTSLEYAGDSMLFVASSCGKVSAWDTRHNSCFMYWDADTAEIDTLTSGSGRLLTGGTAGILRLWSLEGVDQMREPGRTGQISASHGLTLEDEMMLDGAVTVARFDDSLDMGIVGTTAGTLWYINWQERTSIRLISGHAEQVTGIAVTTGGLMATSSADGSVRVWVLHNKEQALQFQVKDHACNCLAFAPSCHDVAEEERDTASPGGNQLVATLAAGYSDGTVRLFNVNTVKMQLKLRPHSVAVTVITFSSDGQMILSGSRDGLIAVSSPTTGMTVRVLNDHRGAPITDIDVTHTQSLGMESRISTPHLWLACSADQRVSIWSADWGRDICDLIDWLTFPSPAFFPDGEIIKDKVQYSRLPVSLARFSSEEPDIVVYTGYGINKCIQFYSLAQRKIIRTTPLTHWSTCLDLAPESPLIALGINERLVKLMDYYESSFQDFTAHDDKVSIVCFTADGSQLLTASYTQIFVWDIIV